MTCHVLHAGDGYTYLTNQVASADVERSAHDPLVSYYAAHGNPPGRWVGSGCSDLGMACTVTEEHMLALFGEALRPDANEFVAQRIAAGDTYAEAHQAARLGRRFARYDQQIPLVEELTKAYAAFERERGRRATVEERRDIKMAAARRLMATQRPDTPAPTRDEVRKYITDQLGAARQPVAGFDLVFSPVKSVSLLWALGGHEIRRVVEEVHEAAWRHALAYGESQAAIARTGAGGVAYVSTSGFVGTAFDHRDSRAGDPDLHTHVAIANRVLAVDGIWRTLDSKQLHNIAVSMSETYNATVEQGLSERLGVRWHEVRKGAGRRVVREIAGMPQEWIRGFSRRREQVEAGYAQLVEDYVRQHGHSPPRSVQIKLAEQATTAPDRPAKQSLRSLADQIAEWIAEASRQLPGVDIGEVMANCLGQAVDQAEPTAVDLAAVAASVVDRVSRDRSTWTVYHLRAEALRQLRAVQYESMEARWQAAETVEQYAVNRESLRLDVEPTSTPRLLQRPDGESVFHRPGWQRYTSQAVLDAEARLLSDARTNRGPMVSRFVRETAIRQFRRESGKTLNHGQRALVEHFVSSGRALAVAIGPPGTGKSTAMRAVREAWEATGGTVIGLAPSAAAASVLGDDLGVRADTLHSLLVAHQNGVEVDVEPGDMLLVDEAGMADTRTLDELRQLAAECGAVVRLVGDHRQLAAVEAGGALRLLHGDVGGIELAEVHRFTDPAEAEAVLRFRVGDDRAIPFYVRNGRLSGGVRSAVLDQLYRDWTADLANGRASIMISDSNEVARELSARAQTERRAAGLVEADGVTLNDGSIAGTGDLVVTRHNQRRLAVLGGRDYVKNGDQWEVIRRHANGRLTVRHVRHGGKVTLPADYVAEWVQLGYAATIHRSQGLTVEVSRSFLTSAAVREAALVAMSRGTEGNYAYLDTEQLLDPDEPLVLPGDLFYRNRDTTEAAAALLAILRREGAERSATETLREALDLPYHLDNLGPQYAYALHVHRGPDAAVRAERWIRLALPDGAAEILTDEAWPALQAVLHDVRDAGADPVALLRSHALRRELDTAESVAKVLHWRITRYMPTARPTPDRPALLPGWISSPPPESPVDADPERTELAAWLQNTAHQIADRILVLGERAVEQMPVWASQLGRVPTDPAARLDWIVRAGQIAAYRERWQIPDTDHWLLPAPSRGAQARAHEWVLTNVLTPTPRPQGPEPSPGERISIRTSAIRTRLGTLRGRLDNPTSAAERPQAGQHAGRATDGHRVPIAQTDPNETDIEGADL